MIATEQEQELTIEALDEQRVHCPKCGGNRMLAYQFEGTHAAYFEGEDCCADSYTDEEYLVKLWCWDCKHVLLDRRQEVWDALEEILVKRPKREAELGELQAWLAEKNWNLPEGNFDEAVHDYFSGMASNVLNDGGEIECLLEIYGLQGAKEFLTGCAAWAGEITPDETN